MHSWKTGRGLFSERTTGKVTNQANPDCRASPTHCWGRPPRKEGGGLEEEGEAEVTAEHVERGENGKGDALLDSRAFHIAGVQENTGEEVTLVSYRGMEVKESERRGSRQGRCRANGRKTMVKDRRSFHQSHHQGSSALCVVPSHQRHADMWHVGLLGLCVCWWLVFPRTDRIETKRLDLANPFFFLNFFYFGKWHTAQKWRWNKFQCQFKLSGLQLTIIGNVNESIDSFPSVSQLVVCWAGLKRYIKISFLNQIDLHLNDLTLIFFSGCKSG